ncbi:MAG: GAF domain-containing protein, partial [Deltaproteobacteria bacterium]|nr:GAF domain-containing protein [Deltaproteobacteria bacterium]
MKSLFNSLRFRIILTGLLTILPLLGLFLYQHLDMLREEKARVRQDLQSLTARVSTWQDDQGRQARQLFTALAATPEVERQDGPALSRLLAKIMEQQQIYANLGAASPDGRIFASGLPFTRPLNIADRHYFKEADATRDFAGAELIMGRITGQATLNVAYPVLNPEGRKVAVLYAALSLDWIKGMVQDMGLNNGCRVSLVAADGTVMAHYPQARQWVGKKVRDTAIFKLLKAETAREGVVEARGQDGRDQIYAFSRLGEGPMAGYVYARVPMETICAAANRKLAINLLALGGVGLLAFGMAWGFGYLFVMRQVNELVGATRRIAAGEFSAPIALGAGSGELGQLAHAFGDMATALTVREELRQQDQERIVRQGALLAGINRIFHEALTSDTEEELARTCLKVAEEITGSAFGFIGSLNHRGRLDTLSMSDPGWAACRITDENVPRLINDMELRGLFGKVLAEGRSLLANDPASHPNSVGTPPDHPPLTAFLGVPLKEAGRAMGMIGLANKAGGYLPEDREVVETLAATMVEPLLRKRAEVEVRSTLSSLNLLVAGIEKIAQVRHSRDVAQEICQLLVEAFDFRLAWLGQAAPGGVVQPLFWAGDTADYLEKVEIRHDDSPLGRGPVGRAIRNRVPAVINDIAADPSFAPWRAAVEEKGYRAVSALPLITQGAEPFGALIVYSGQADFFTPKRVEILNSFARIAAAILENARLIEETQKRLGQLSALRKIDLAISGATDLRVTLDVLLEQVLSHLSFDATAVLLFNPHANLLEHTASRGLDTNQLIHSQVSLGDPCLVAQALRDRRGVRLSDLSAAAGDNPHVQAMLAQGFVSYLAEPLVSSGKNLGVLEAYCRTRVQFDAVDLEFLEALAGQAAIAIDNAALFNDLRRSHQNLALAYDATLEGLARTTELRDYETGGHCERVTEMTMRLGQRLGVSGQELEHLRRGALLHDIGKIGIPDSILL